MDKGTIAKLPRINSIESGVVLCLVLAACKPDDLLPGRSPSARRAAGDEYSESMNEVEAARAQLFVHLQCAAAPPKSRCGLLADEFMQPAFMREFGRRVCKEDPDAPPTRECAERFGTMYAARLRRRYPFADPAAVNNYCDAEPFDCENMRGREAVWLSFHNKELEGRVQLAKQAIEARLSAKVQALNAEEQQRMAAALASLQVGKATVVCRTYGNVTRCDAD
jgi:hypothetical protein